LLDFFCHTVHPDIRVGIAQNVTHKRRNVPSNFRVKERAIQIWR
jgi:hypothetical protein